MFYAINEGENINNDPDYDTVILDVIYGHDTMEGAVNEFKNNPDIEAPADSTVYVREVAEEAFVLDHFE